MKNIYFKLLGLVLFALFALTLSGCSLFGGVKTVCGKTFAYSDCTYTVSEGADASVQASAEQNFLAFKAGDEGSKIEFTNDGKAIYTFASGSTKESTFLEVDSQVLVKNGTHDFTTYNGDIYTCYIFDGSKLTLTHKLQYEGTVITIVETFTLVTE